VPRLPDGILRYAVVKLGAQLPPWRLCIRPGTTLHQVQVLPGRHRKVLGHKCRVNRQ
jgi:hypothetical protein